MTIKLAWNFKLKVRKWTGSLSKILITTYFYDEIKVSFQFSYYICSKR